MSDYKGPQQSGSSIAYEIEVKDKNGFWERIPMTLVTEGGVPTSHYSIGIHKEIGLYGYEAAMALAWQYKAHVPFSVVRIVPYLMEYSIKTTPQGEPMEIENKPPVGVKL